MATEVWYVCHSHANEGPGASVSQAHNLHRRGEKRREWGPVKHQCYAAALSHALSWGEGVGSGTRGAINISHHKKRGGTETVCVCVCVCVCVGGGHICHTPPPARIFFYYWNANRSRPRGFSSCLCVLVFIFPSFWCVRVWRKGLGFGRKPWRASWHEMKKWLRLSFKILPVSENDNTLFDPYARNQKYMHIKKSSFLLLMKHLWVRHKGSISRFYTFFTILYF